MVRNIYIYINKRKFCCLILRNIINVKSVLESADKCKENWKYERLKLKNDETKLNEEATNMEESSGTGYSKRIHQSQQCPLRASCYHA